MKTAEQKARHAQNMRRYRSEGKYGGRLTKEVRRAQLDETSGLDKPMQTRPLRIDIPTPEHGLKIAIIPDTQCKPGSTFEHLEAYGRYIADKQPDIIIHMGDHADMQSLSTYDQGKRASEGRRIKNDLDAAHAGMDALMNPITRAIKTGVWEPEKFFLDGNHEYRIERAIETDAKWEGMLSLDSLKYADYGWRRFKFLQPIIVGGVAFCHYFPSGVMGRPITSAKAILANGHMSACAAHQQGFDIAHAQRLDGVELKAIISGSFYQHDEDYLSPIANSLWRGAYFLHEVRDGAFEVMQLSLDYLLRRYKK